MPVDRTNSAAAPVGGAKTVPDRRNQEERLLKESIERGSGEHGVQKR